MKNCEICDKCGKNTPGIRVFSEFSHMKMNILKGYGDRSREFLEPIFVNYQELCYPCYCTAVKRYKEKKI